MSKTTEGELVICSFCKKDQEEVRWLIAGPEVHICDECVQVCNEIIAEHVKEELDRRPAEAATTAVQDLIDQAAPEIATTAGDRDVRVAATKKVTDQAVLTKIAKTDSEWYVRAAAARKLTDKTQLAEIANTDIDVAVRATALAQKRLLCAREELDRVEGAEAAQNTAATLMQKSIPSIDKKWSDPSKPFQTTSAEEAAGALFGIALDEAPVWEEGDIRSEYQGFVDTWGSRELTVGQDEDLFPRVLRNLQWTASEPGFSYFTVAVRKGMDLAQVVSCAEGRAASLCLWRTQDRLYLCGNRHFQ